MRREDQLGSPTGRHFIISVLQYGRQGDVKTPYSNGGH